MFNKKIALATAMSVISLLATNLGAQAEDSTFFSTTTGYVVAPARYAGKLFLMPTRIFRRGDAHEVVATTSRTVVYDREATIGAGPGVVVTTVDGSQTMVPTVNYKNPTLFVTTGATVTNLKINLPNDLLTRRDDLIARVYTLKAQGKLNDSQASGLLAEIQTVSAMPCPTACERTTAEARQIKMMYRDFDKVSNDIFMESKQGDRQLAGKYSYISL